MCFRLVPACNGFTEWWWMVVYRPTLQEYRKLGHFLTTFGSTPVYIKTNYPGHRPVLDYRLVYVLTLVSQATPSAKGMACETILTRLALAAIIATRVKVAAIPTTTQSSMNDRAVFPHAVFPHAVSLLSSLFSGS